jgi:hypothetical protein
MKRLTFLSHLFLLPCVVTFAANATAQEGYRTIQIDASRVVGQIKSFQGMNGTPAPVMAGLPDLTAQYKALRVSQVRTHDVMGPADIDAHFALADPTLKWLIPDDAQRDAVVKAGNAAVIFPDMSADPEKPQSYNFVPTDKMLTAIHDSGEAIYYRIGRSFGAQPKPPADFDKYASVVKHIAMHYNKGWAGGFKYKVMYWEFWNEADMIFWSGTPEQFYSLYEKTARALKSVDPDLKVGGNAVAMASTNGPYREGFIDYCSEHSVPLDFYSWHTYAMMSADPYDAVRISREIREVLSARDFSTAENILSEWNLTPDFTDVGVQELRSMHNAAFVGSVLTYLQDSPVDAAMFYRGDAAWMGLFDQQGKFYKPAYTFKAMGQMQDTPQRLATQGADTYGFAAIAGSSGDNKTVQIFLSNYAIPANFKPAVMKMPAGVPDPSLPAFDVSKFQVLPPRTDIVYKDNAGYNVTVANLPWGKKAYTMQRYRLSKTQDLEMVEQKEFSGPEFKLANEFPVDTVELIVLRRK